MNQEFYIKSIEYLLVQVEKLQEEKDFYKEQSEDYKGELEILLTIVAVSLVVYFMTSTIGMVM